jgi:erythronate-4-phosphate dehydrogenase
MMAMKIITDENIPLVKEHFKGIGEVRTVAGREINTNILTDADILLVRSITEVNQYLLDDLNLKFIASATSGINHIDLDYLNRKGIGFAHALGSNAISVAQYVVSAICYWSLKKQKELKQLNIGIIGYGNVGKILESLCVNLGVKCVLHDPPLEDLTDNKIDFKSLDEALKCDIVSLHVPFTTDGNHPTQRLISDDEINAMKTGSLLINTSRGGVVDERALLARKYRLNDIEFILDVWENEPAINQEALKHALIATPHIAGYSYDGKIRGTQMIYQACCDYFELEATYKFNLNVDFKVQEINPLVEKDIRKSLTKAYDIAQDGLSLKKTLNQPGLLTPEYFDALRKNYPIRREWKWVN